MEEEKLKKRIEAFRISCKVYPYEKEYWEKLQSSENTDKILLQFIQEDIDFVEKTFDKIEESFGKKAREMVYALYVEEKTQTQAAEEMGITRRQLQYSLDQIRDMLGESQLWKNMMRNGK